jgi:hypothetical protein
LLERHVTFLEFVHNLFQALEAVFKLGQCRNSNVILPRYGGGAWDFLLSF